MIKSFKHKGLKAFFETGNLAGIQAAHAHRLRKLLRYLNSAKMPLDMDVPGWAFHALQGRLHGYFAVRVSGNWRLTFRFDGNDAIIVDYQDYH